MEVGFVAEEEVAENEARTQRWWGCQRLSSELTANSCETSCWLAIWATECFYDCPSQVTVGRPWLLNNQPGTAAK